MSTAFNMAHDKSRIGMCLKIAKFSYTTVYGNPSSAAWTHLSAADIHVLLDGPQSLTPLHLKVLHGNTCIECVEMSSLIDATVGRNRHAAQPQTAASFDQHPIYAIVKEYRIALRYHLQEGGQRRVQFCMQSLSDAETLLSLFKRRGMIFQPQGSERSVVQVENVNQAIQAASHGQKALPKSVTSQSRYFDSTQSTNRSPFSPRTVETGSLSSRNFNEPKEVDATLRLPPASQETTSQMYPHGVQELATAEMGLGAPISSQIYRSSTIPPQLSLGRVDRQQEMQSEPSNSNSNSRIVRETANYRSSPLRKDEVTRTESHGNQSTSTMQRSWQPAEMPPPTITDHCNAAGASDRRETDSAGSRPLTSSSSNFPFPDTLEHEIPPRRELPFDKRPSSSRQSGSHRSGSRPGSAAVLPTKNSRRPNARLDPPSSPPQRANNPAQPSRPQTASGIKRPAITAFGDTQRPLTAIAPRPSFEKPGIRPVENILPVPHRDNPMPRPTPRMDELLYGKRSAVDQKGVLPSRLGSLADAPHQPECIPTLPNPDPNLSPSPSHFLPTTTTTDDPSLRASAALPNVTSLEADPSDWAGLNAYSTQSLEDRHAALDAFMVRNLENPGFARLCEDVENCWRRIALGL